MICLKGTSFWVIVLIVPSANYVTVSICDLLLLVVKALNIVKFSGYVFSIIFPGCFFGAHCCCEPSPQKKWPSDVPDKYRQRNDPVRVHTYEELTGLMQQCIPGAQKKSHEYRFIHLVEWNWSGTTDWLSEKSMKGLIFTFHLVHFYDPCT